jgi:hypothetical protein
VTLLVFVCDSRLVASFSKLGEILVGSVFLRPDHSLDIERRQSVQHRLNSLLEMELHLLILLILVLLDPLNINDELSICFLEFVNIDFDLTKAEHCNLLSYFLHYFLLGFVDIFSDVFEVSEGFRIVCTDARLENLDFPVNFLLHTGTVLLRVVICVYHVLLQAV